MFRLLILVVALVSGLQGREVPEGFVSLFNGKDLSGWRGNPVHWSVENGCIVGVTDGSLKRNRFLIWEGGEVENFELRLQVRVSEGGNSGVQYRSRERPDLGEWILSGYQSDVLPAVRDLNGMFYEEQGRRILGRAGEKVVVDRQGFPWVVGEMEVKDFPAGIWRDYRLVVRGNHHRHWIDGHPTADAIDDDVAGRSLSGLLGVQVHVGPAMKVEYRDIWLKALPPQLPRMEAEISPEARLVRPQQRLPKDWVAPTRGQFVRLLDCEEVTWDGLRRNGFEGGRAYRISALKDSSRSQVLRVWFGGEEKAKVAVQVDQKTVFEGVRINPTWQFLEIPVGAGSLVQFEAPAGVFWAEPSLWSLPKEN